MFQQKETAEDLEEVAIAYADVAGPEGELQIRLPKLLVQLGLALQVPKPTARSPKKPSSSTAKQPTAALISLSPPCLPASSSASASAPRLR